MNSSSKPSSQLLSHLSETHKYLLLIIFIIGNLGHLFSSIILTKKSWRKKVCVFYFNVLLVYNTIYINTRILSPLLRLYFNYNIQDQSVFLCKFHSYITNLFTSLVPTVLALASIDRLLISSHNIDTRLYSSKRLAYFSISIGTLIWCLFYIHAFVNHNLQRFSPFTPAICFYSFSDILIQFYSYSTVFINLFVSLSMIILILLALINVRRGRQRIRRNAQNHVMSRKDIQLLRCLFVYDVIYALFSLPIHIYYLCITVTRDYEPADSEDSFKSVFYNFLYLIYHFPYCCSFFIFIFVSKNIRLDLKRLLMKCFWSCSIETREEQTDVTQRSRIATNAVAPVMITEISCQNIVH